MLIVMFIVFILQTPGHFLGQFNQFALERVFSDILGDTTFVAWADDSRYVIDNSISNRIILHQKFFKFFSIFAVGSKDATVRLYTLENYSNFRTYSLTGHADTIVGIFFEENSLDMMTVSRYIIVLTVL